MNLNQTGIYKITNTQNGKFYIGSARKSFELRFRTHKSTLSKNKHKNIYLQRAYNQLGLEFFKFEILEICEGDAFILTREQFYIDTLKPEYNLAKNVKQPRLGVKHSKETKEKISKSGMGRPAWNKGQEFSEETKNKMSLSKKGIKLNRTLGLSNKEVIRDDGKEYKNVYYAALDLNVKQNTIIKAISDKKINRKVKGYSFKYKL